MSIFRIGFCIIIGFLMYSKTGVASVLVAHRGLHQNYDREQLDFETCTAERIKEPTHNFLENTLESIEKSFKYGADIVEIDIHPTTEIDIPDNLVVFHDWTLNCRTDATCASGCKCNRDKCVTHEQTLDYLQKLDIGHGYTYDGATHPFAENF